jgi:hypothetical protein
MVTVIMGLKGNGKTKKLIELVNIAVEEEDGDIVCIEVGAKLRYDIPYTVRLIDSTMHEFYGYHFLKGFICGLFSGNYDITHIFIDSLLRVLGLEIDDRMEEFLVWCEEFSMRENVNFTITISADVSLASDVVKKYF